MSNDQFISFECAGCEYDTYVPYGSEQTNEDGSLVCSECAESGPQYQLTSNHVDVRCEVYSPREQLTEMEVRCECGDWVDGFALGGHFHSDDGGPITQTCECGREWAIGAVEVRRNEL